MYKNRKKISLLFNANKAFDRGVIRGIGEYIKKSQCDWDVYIEEDFRYTTNTLLNCDADGVIADFDDPIICSFFSKNKFNVVGVGGSYVNKDNYPNIPYVASDNYKLVLESYRHLKEKGIQNFAFYGVENKVSNLWAKERENAFRKIVAIDGYDGGVFLGNEITADNWVYSLNRLEDWIQSLPKPIGIIAVTDSRARHIFQVCASLGILVPDQVSIIGIDNEEIAQYLSRISLSSIEQGTFNIGYEAAKILNSILSGGPFCDVIRLIGPAKVHERQSTDFKSVTDPYVIQAINYIRLNAFKGIKVEQVVDKVGISRSNLECRFKEEFGHTLHQEIHNIKLFKAKDYICNTDLSFLEISDLCGYPSIQYMYAIFKKEFSMTPKECRQNNQLNLKDKLYFTEEL